MWLRISFVKILQFALLVGCSACAESTADTPVFADFAVEPKMAHVEFFWKDDNGSKLKSIQNLKNYAESKNRRLRFAMNGGMYQEDNKPLGLFIQDGKLITPLNLRSGDGNFYLKPNGVFYLTNDEKASIVQTVNFQNDGSVKFATQSGPMLLIDGQINAAFASDSQNTYIRNGVCVSENGQIIFAISLRTVSFYEFAVHFKNIGCRNALYLDGFVSRMYAPEQNIEALDGNFGVIIGIIE